MDQITAKTHTPRVSNHPRVFIVSEQQRLRRLDHAFSLAILGLFLVPIVLNLYSSLLLLNIKSSRLSYDSRNRYIFTALVNLGAIFIHSVLIYSII